MQQSQLKSIKVLDGGFGFEAIKRSSLKINGHKLWSCRLLLDDPDLVVAIHRDFVAAGAEVIQTNTYQANVDTFIEALPDSMTPSKAAEALASGVTLARQAAGGPDSGVLVAGSCGPYGAALCDLSEYTGDYCDTMSEEELMNWHRPRVLALASAGPDVLAFDTVPALKEARAIGRLMREFPNLPAWISFATLDGRLSCHGEPLADCAEAALRHPGANVFGLGVNCTSAPCNISNALSALRPAATGDTKTLIVYPNMGVEANGPVEQPLHELAPDWLRLGAGWIGGCCGVGPQEIARLAGVVRGFREGAAAQ